MFDTEDSMLNHLVSADLEGFIKTGMEYADVVIKTEEEYNEELNKLFEEFENKEKLDTIDDKDNLGESYFNLYNELVN